MSRSLVATTGHSVPLSSRELWVGSGPAVDIPIRADLGLLPRHFVISPQPGACYLTASEGAQVLVNGLTINSTTLQDGDQIVAGLLELTYRDDEAASLPPDLPASAGVQSSYVSPPSLLGGYPHHPSDASSSPDPYPSPATTSTPPRVIYRTELGDITSISGGRRDHLWMMLLGFVLMGIGGLAVYSTLFESTGPLTAEDIIVKEARITGGTYHRVRRSSSWTELHTDLPGSRIIELPDGLHFSPAWVEGGSIAQIGFEKRSYLGASTNALGGATHLPVATLEVNGRSYRTLATHNAAREADQRLVMAGGLICMLVGLWLLFTGWEKRKARR